MRVGSESVREVGGPEVLRKQASRVDLRLMSILTGGLVIFWMSRRHFDASIYGLAKAIQRAELFMSKQLEQVLTKVTGLETANDSLIALVQGLAQTIRDNADDPKALTQLADRLDADTNKVVQAVTDNTPAAEGTVAQGTGESTGTSS